LSQLRVPLLLLFADETLGELIYEIVAKSVLPAAVEVQNGRVKVECSKKC
jgi:hypothetical protein